ncbi:TraB/GumN family protein [Aureispira anguillae]|uniref:TraB/GumN family protein n=1 Tax=Aureispira anguillae TaxID=2864201 RepID=A0A915YJX9_9BACT|nr:TraB/GumN family protein [Aureispira anguillae]BDS14593.1 TraB/GumN family protein [Aureispira anguillae]
MLKTLSTLLTIVICWTCSLAPATAQKDAPKDEKLTKSLLWKVTGKGIKPSYVFGTIHMIGAEDFFWNKSMDKAFKKTKKLVMEMDMSQQMAMAVEMMKLAPMKGGETLKDLVSEEDYELIKTYFTEEAKSPQAKMTFAMAQNWQPMLLQSLLYMEMIDGPVKMYEMELTSKAKEEDMAFGGLETVADQMSVFNSIPYKTQAQALVEMIKNLKEGKGSENEFSKMVVFYKEQDIDGMLDAMQGELDEMENQAELLDNRNIKWIPQIMETSKETPTFYAVGAGHLGGENGVIRLLKKEGFKVTPVK